MECEAAPLPSHIHILGASGSSTSTLAKAISLRHGHRFLDTDDFYWKPTDPPFQTSRPVAERLGFLGVAMAASPTWVLSGSLCGWGDALVEHFDLVVFLIVDRRVRLERLRLRELRRFGPEALAPGGRHCEAHLAFMDWAAAYEDGGPDVRSRVLHESWLRTLTCPVLRLEGDLSVEERLRRLEAHTPAEGGS
jgi:adenylate kinase family enzyme